jgi:hypothetical protein
VGVFGVCVGCGVLEGWCVRSVVVVWCGVWCGGVGVWCMVCGVWWCGCGVVVCGGVGVVWWCVVCVCGGVVWCGGVWCGGVWCVVCGVMCDV